MRDRGGFVKTYVNRSREKKGLMGVSAKKVIDRYPPLIPPAGKIWGTKLASVGLLIGRDACD